MADNNLFVGDGQAIKYSDSESLLQMPNEIFYRLQELDFNSGKHMLFGFIYYYNIAWIYRYCKIDDLIKNDISYANQLKELCGISTTTKTFDYITKRNGVLDKGEITKVISFNSVPALYHRDNDSKIVEFSFNRDYDLLKRHNNNTNIKEPLLHTEERVVNETAYLGAYHDYDFTFTMSMREYNYMKTVLGLSFDTIGFYYYLKSIAYYHGGKINLSRESMSRQLNISEKTITKYKTILKDSGLIYEFDNGSYTTRKNNTLRLRKVEI